MNIKRLIRYDTIKCISYIVRLIAVNENCAIKKSKLAIKCISCHEMSEYKKYIEMNNVKIIVTTL